MKFWKTGIVLAWGALLPALGLAQEPWITQGSGYGPPGMPPAGYGPPPTAFEYGAPPPAGLYQELVPQSQFRYQDDSRPRLTFKEAFSESYIRLDYLFWNISGSDKALLGAPSSSTADLSGKTPNNMLLATDFSGPRAPVPTSAVVPSLRDGNNNDLNGLRGVVGIPTRIGTLETEAFYFENLNNGVVFEPYTRSNGVPVIAATTLLRNGALSPNTMILYSEDYRAVEKATFFGAESNWILPPLTPNIPLTTSPVIGFRYIHLTDRLNIDGTDIPDPDDLTTTMEHHIGSIARNNIFGPQIGLRFKTNIGRLELGAEPKFVAGINRLTEGVSTRQIYTPTEPNMSYDDSRTVFSPMFDLSLSSKLHLSERFSLYVAYDLIIAGRVSRSYNIIDYDSPVLQSDPTHIGLQRNLDNFIAQGLAIGGELTFR